MKPEAITSSYRRWAPIYDFTFGRITNTGRRHATKVANTIGGRVLEVGVGTGLALPYYNPSVEVTGIDFSEDMLIRARAKVAEEKLGHVRELRQMDARELDFPDASFDTVVAMHLISVVPDPERVMAEMARVCKPGGQILLVNHFARDEGWLAWLERKFAPFADWMGWHSNFPKDRVLGVQELQLMEDKPLTSLGMFTFLRMEKAA
ncbi:class I SAM-dependent methyltransferase [Roseinatronobacter bogoriensis]|uniref:Class I SAM-dependent methyltransferase n=1 Tax=Roseinatronobacter bogoriensis subsp. barguzinensis TaxID=441209 RepID=A0A2K8KFD6_9RHOB|nr:MULTISPECIES: class I SAM-dependent methyltransferase [Rhodobaca]ATX66475.1 class I SAM-dependent methyltransferase [Rhodobaca barguzinensis]MBB4207625.1 phosphatidylethanolamine/phosphatidyl-N-methylethanolamine N-methyltransferase [Rhodobaca bogoriensis DSM 18756]TDW40068.1 phosphatidylethanolamine/phosphatidyl-N-methylethanolamine N-methyltransferase [Rhodobaca barguzinensis]TDY70779.1 phosphatidylethanolamine N-methyltransferase /phosphatidyl-N-methylethanolamine N-methyltransferase [Rho